MFLGPIEIVIIALILGFIVAVVLLISFAVRQKPTFNPNLTPCPDCGNQVSLNAENCPKCGNPLKPQIHDPEGK